MLPFNMESLTFNIVRTPCAVVRVIMHRIYQILQTFMTFSRPWKVHSELRLTGFSKILLHNFNLPKSSYTLYFHLLFIERY